MYNIHTVLLLFVLMANVVILVVTVGTVVTIVGMFSAWIWQMIASPPVPPWKRYHIGLSHVNTIITKLCKINWNARIPVTYRTIG